MGLDRMGRDGMGWDGMGWDRMGWGGMRWDGIGSRMYLRDVVPRGSCHVRHVERQVLTRYLRRKERQSEPQIAFLANLIPSHPPHLAPFHHRPCASGEALR